MAVGPQIVMMAASWRALPWADLYLDCRAVPHPPLRLDPEGCIDWLRHAAPDWVERYADVIHASLATLPARRPNGLDVYRVCCVCAEGQYRSIGMARLLEERFCAS